MKKDTTNDMTVGSPVSLIIKFMIPMCLGNLFQQFYNIADSIVAGKFIGVNALAAIGSTGSLMFFVTGWLNGLSSGFAIIVAQMFGAKKFDRMRHYVAMSIYLMAAFSIVMTIGFSLANKPILHLMNSPEEVFGDVTAYMGIIYAGLIITGAYNALAAFTVGITLGIDSKKAAGALANYVPAGMRQKSVNVGGIISIEDCYNASPDSMNAAIKTLANVNTNKRIAVLGDMLELGDFSKKAHSDVGKMVADNNIDYLLAYGNDAKYIVDGAKQNGMKNAFYFDNKDELSNKLFELAHKGDAVIFKASRGMKLEDVINNVYNRWEK